MKKIENMGIDKMVSMLDNMNPRGSFKIGDEDTIVMKGIAPQYCKYPEGYYYNAKNGVTNKHNTYSGMYETFKVVVQK